MPPVTTPSAPLPSVPRGPLVHFLAHPDAWWMDLGHQLSRLSSHVLAVGMPLVLAVAALVVTLAVLRLVARFRATGGGSVVEVAVPATVEPKAALVFWRNLHPVLAARHRLFERPRWAAFEMEGSGDGIGLRLWVPPGISTQAVARAICSAWPGAQCTTASASGRLLARSTSTCAELRLASPQWLPLGTDHVVDPERVILGTLPVWEDGERGVVQVLVRAATARTYRLLARAARSLQTGRPIALLPRILALWRNTPARPVSPDPLRAAEVRQAVAKACDLPAFEVVVRYGLSTSERSREARRRLRARSRELSAAFGVYAGRNGLVARRRPGCRRRLERRMFAGGQVLGLSEVAALAHLPFDGQVPGLAHASAAVVAPPVGVLATIGDARDAHLEDDDAYF